MRDDDEFTTAVTARVTLRDTVTGTTRTLDPCEWQEGEEGDALWHWTEGNFGCDCNRSLLLWPGDASRELGCGHHPNRIVIDRIDLSDGRVILTPDAERP